MIRLGDADPELLDAFMDSRSRRAQALSAIASGPVAASPSTESSAPGSWAAGFAQSLHGTTKAD